jgi:ferredoxin-nitrate reductase
VGITAAAEHQAEIIAKYIAGDWASYYQGSLSMNIMKIQGVQLCSLGMIDAPTNNPEYEEIIFIDKAKRYYKNVLFTETNW